jgi:hypothetical protein
MKNSGIQLSGHYQTSAPKRKPISLIEVNSGCAGGDYFLTSELDRAFPCDGQLSGPKT